MTTITTNTKIYTPNDVYSFASSGNFDELRIALNQGGSCVRNWYRDNDGYTAIHSATIDGYIKCIEILLEKGINIINSKTKSGASAIYLATIYGRINVIELLFRSPDLDINIMNNNGVTSIHRA